MVSSSMHEEYRKLIRSMPLGGLVCETIELGAVLDDSDASPMDKQIAEERLCMVTSLIDEEE